MNDHESRLGKNSVIGVQPPRWGWKSHGCPVCGTKDVNYNAGTYLCGFSGGPDENGNIMVKSHCRIKPCQCTVNVLQVFGCVCCL